jgi:hypothetical protein
MTSATLRAWSTVALWPVFAVYEGNRIDTTRAPCLVGHGDFAVPVPPLGIDRQLDKGARRGGRLRPPLIGASVAHRNSHANKLLDIAQGGHLLAVAQRGDFNGFYFVVNGTPRLGGAS